MFVNGGGKTHLSNHIDGAFYVDEPGALTAETLQRSIGAAYDLRSTYVHTGRHFGIAASGGLLR